MNTSNRTFKHNIGCILLAIGIVTLPALSQGQIIYEATGTLDASSGTPINGKTLDVASGIDGGTSGATWTASGVTEGASTDAGANVGTGAYAYLPLNVQSGYIYTLTATLNTAAPGSTVNTGLILGFFGTIGSGSPNLFDSVAVANSTQPEVISGSASNPSGGALFGTDADSGLQQDVTVKLNTTGALWSGTLTMSSGATSSFTYVANNPGINSVGFVESGGAVARVADFELQGQVVPEPSTWAMLVVGTLGLFFFGRARARGL